MKTLILFFLSLSTQTMLFSSNLPIVNEKQIWFNEQENLTIEIEFSRSCIRVRNMDKGRWVSYSGYDGVYENRRGELMIREAEDVFVFASPRRRANIVFRPFKGLSDREIGQDSRLTPPSSVLAIEGTWSIPELNNRKLIIRSIEGGLEARFEQGKWVRYVMRDYNFYVDSKGNSYTVKTEDNLFWESEDGRQSYDIVR